ncbi:hypothetical protein HJ056_18445 [Vibrio parahaemolyticus]|nr:hypothetical protein [Vibrio parahaemolyticus]MBE4266823.1 hypothetical protein [Vibrio parahaemolyticus]MBE4335934.1 hypothetical protein [Vibrio parahaemolyticus]MBE4358185.1 hypothetical protein [Vibrio parahaemolyticus]MBE5168197.1 hypothetical protein [Vibrio parahaemolyticus]
MADKFEIDVKAFAKARQSGQDLNGKNGLLAPLIKQVTKRLWRLRLMSIWLKKNWLTVSTAHPEKQSKHPLVRFNSIHHVTEMERKIISLFALDNSYQNIREHLIDLYDLEVSNGTINANTDRLVPELRAWQERDLESVYPIVWLDAIYYKIKENGRFTSKAVYTILRLNLDGKKKSCSDSKSLKPRGLVIGSMY